MVETLDDLLELLEKYEEGDIDGYELGDWVYNQRHRIKEIRDALNETNHTNT